MTIFSKLGQSSIVVEEIPAQARCQTIGADYAKQIKKNIPNITVIQTCRKVK